MVQAKRWKTEWYKIYSYTSRTSMHVHDINTKHNFTGRMNFCCDKSHNLNIHTLIFIHQILKSSLNNSHCGCVIGIQSTRVDPVSIALPNTFEYCVTTIGCCNYRQPIDLSKDSHSFMSFICMITCSNIAIILWYTCINLCPTNNDNNIQYMLLIRVRLI